MGRSSGYKGLLIPSAWKSVCPPPSEKPKLNLINHTPENAHKQSAAHAAQTQALFDGLQTQTQAETQPKDVGDVSVDLMITPIKDEEKNRIEATKKELEEERRKFTEAAVRLGREKAALEVRFGFFIYFLKL
jgi:hypothetical protein